MSVWQDARIFYFLPKKHLWKTQILRVEWMFLSSVISLLTWLLTWRPDWDSQLFTTKRQVCQTSRSLRKLYLEALKFYCSLSIVRSNVISLKRWQLGFPADDYNVALFLNMSIHEVDNCELQRAKYQSWAGARPHVQPPSFSRPFGSQDKVTDQGNLQEKSISQVPKQVLWHSMTIYWI